MMKYEFTGETKDIKPGGKAITLHRIRAAKDFGDVKKGEPGGWIETEINLSHNGDAWVSGDAWVFGDARVSGNAQVSGNAWVSGNAQVSSNAQVSDARHVFTAGPIGSRNDFVTFFKDKGGGISVKCGCFSGNIGEFLEEVRKTHGDSEYAHEYRLAVESAKACIRLAGDCQESSYGRAQKPGTGKCYREKSGTEHPEEIEAEASALEEIQQYRAIGTVEECREAMEKQRGKNPSKDEYNHACCPACGWVVYQEEYGGRYLPHCENCGQAIDWDNQVVCEEME